MKTIFHFFLLIVIAISKNTYSVEKYNQAELDLALKNASCITCKLKEKFKENIPTTFIKIKVDDQNQLAPEIINVIKNYGFDPAVEGFDILIGVKNDHNAFAMGLIKERGDDFGYTHGAILEIGTKLNKNYNVKFKYATDLYSKPIDGEIIKLDNDNYSVRQYITNENLARLILDNYDIGKIFYWKAEVGWHQFDHIPNDGNFLLGSTEQLRFHKLLNSIKPGMNMIPISEYDGKPNRDGLFAGIILGSEQIFSSENQKVRLLLKEEVGAEYSMATDSEYLSVDTSATLTYQKAPRKLAFEIGVGYKAKTHNDGVENTSYIDLGIGKAKKWKVGVRAEYFSGTLNNDSDYNLINPELGINDPVARIYYKYYTD